MLISTLVAWPPVERLDERVVHELARANELKLHAVLMCAAIVAITSAGAVACRDNTSAADPSRLVYGPSVNFAQGSARSWVQLDAAGVPTSLGIAMTETALVGLPTTVSGPNPSALMVTLPLPAEAATTGFDHADLGWNPLGHDPMQIYGLPHFDMHFYMASSATQLAILPNDPQWASKAAKLPAPADVPARYVPPPAPIAVTRFRRWVCTGRT